jgi:prepilin-type N-terminal cleavage/methylation domain-containing protein
MMMIQQSHNTLTPNKQKSGMLYSHGFTLLEMLLVIMIVGVIAASIGALFAQVFSDFIQGRELADRQSQASLALERMVRDVRSADSQNLVNNGAELNLDKIENGISNTYRFRIDNNNNSLNISVNDGPEHVLARHVDESSFFDIKEFKDVQGTTKYRIVILHLNIEMSDSSLLEFSAAAVPRRQ